MSDFGKPRGCNNGCGSLIYFDAHSSVGHPTSDKWLPLEYKEGRKTDQIHNCPKKPINGNVTKNVTSVTTQQEQQTLTVQEDAIEALTLEFKALLKHITEYVKANK